MIASPRLVAGSLLVAVPAVFMAGFTGLQMSFADRPESRHRIALTTRKSDPSPH